MKGLLGVCFSLCLRTNEPIGFVLVTLIKESSSETWLLPSVCLFEDNKMMSYIILVDDSCSTSPSLPLNHNEYHWTTPAAIYPQNQWRAVTFIPRPSDPHPFPRKKTTARGAKRISESDPLPHKTPVNNPICFL